MQKIIYLVLLSWSLSTSDSIAEETGPALPAIPYDEQALLGLVPESAGAEPPSIATLLSEVNRNSDNMTRLLDKVVSEGCSRQLQEDTIKLVGNMTRNIQIMTDVIIRMGYNIEQMSRAPKAMNSFPFMP